MVILGFMLPISESSLVYGFLCVCFGLVQSIVQVLLGEVKI